MEFAEKKLENSHHYLALVKPEDITTLPSNIISFPSPQPKAEANPINYSISNIDPTTRLYNSGC